MSVDKVFKITEEELKAIRKSYDRTDTEIEEDVQYLKDWLKKQPHLPQDEDETRLRMMLHHNKFSLEKTKKKFDMYYSIKHFVPEFYTDREPLNPQVSQLMDELILMPLPNLNSELHRIYISKISGEDIPSFSITLYLQLVFGMFDLRIVNDSSIGDQFIMDLKNIRFAQVAQCTPVAIKKAYNLLQKAYSDKIKGMHFINLPPYANPIVVLLNTILSEKMANRVHVHKNLESLQKCIPPEVLPSEYGGTAGPIKELYDEWRKFYTSKNNWLKELAEKKSDESKRIGKPIDSDIFGMCGSFRKLGLD